MKLTKLYRKGESAYGSIKNLVRVSGIPERLVKQFLHSKASYTKHRQAKRKHDRLPVRCRFINEIWCMDLAQVDKLADSNGGIKYLMLIVDVFSRFVRVGTMRNKSAETAKACFINLCSEKNDLMFPRKLWIDSGKEFLADFKNFCEDAGIRVYSTHTEKKALFAERYIQSFKNILYRFLEERKTTHHKKHLQEFVNTMNSRVNNTTGLAPKDVRNHHYLQVLHSSRQQMKIPKLRKPKLQPGDKVRLAYAEKSFRKGYKAQFSDDVYEIVRITTIKPVVTYQVKDETGETLKGRYYEQELQKTII